VIVAVTGHRPPKLGGYRIPNPVYDEVVGGLRQALERLNPELVLSGMSLGVDQWTAEICIDLGIPFDAIIPFHGYENRWPDRAKRHYEVLKSHANHVHVVTNTHAYNSNLLYRRNAWMVDHCGLLLAVFNGSRGGTANCVDYADRRGKQVSRIPIRQEIWNLAAEIGRRFEPVTPAVTRTTNPTVEWALHQQGYAALLNQILEIERTAPDLMHDFDIFIGQPATGEVMRQLQLAATRVQNVIAGRTIPRRTNEPPELRDLRTLDALMGGEAPAVAPSILPVPVIGIDTARGDDQTVVQVVTSETPEKKEESSVERFRPGRRIRIDD
jgi:uncharacterized phage-like protein YoqJ